MRQCKTCGHIKPLGDFPAAPRYKEGRKPHCADCTRAYQREYMRRRYLEDPESHRARARQWAKNNPEKCRAREKLYRQANPDRVKKWDRTKYIRHKDKCLARISKWVEENRERKNEISRQWAARNKLNIYYHCMDRKLRLLNATPAWADRKYIMLWYEHAKLEEIRTGRKCHVDHIVPLKSDRVSGLHNEWNLQVVAATENIRKGNREWPEMFEAA